MLKNTTLLCVLLLWTGLGFAQDRQDRKTAKGEYSLLWEISGKGLKKPSYVFGTMHINDSRVFEFSDSVLIKFDGCEGFASEIHPDSLSGGRYSYMYYPDLRIAYSDLFKDSTTKAVEALKFDQPYLLRSFYARASQYDIDKPVFLDAYLFNLAKRQGKVVSELELIEEHINLVDLQGNASATGMGGFKFKFDFFGNEDRSNDFIDTYRSGNIKAIDSVMNLGGRGNSEYIYHLLDRRNIVMAHRIDSIAHHRSTFFAIGAAHLPGKNGVLEILRKKGYKVRRVTATFKGVRDQYVPKNNPIQWPVIKQDIYGYSFSMPGNIYRGYENQDTFRIHTYIDLGANTVFQTFCIDYSKHLDKVKGKDLQRKIVISMLESGDKEAKEEFAVVSRKAITQEGVTGEEVLIKGPIHKGFAWRRRGNKKSDVDTIWIRVQTFNHQDRVYVNRVYGTQDLVNGADATRYFQSVHFYTPIPYKAYQPYVVNSKDGAFVAQFEKPSLRNESVYIENPSDTGSIKRSSYYFMNTNLCNEDGLILVAYDDNFNMSSDEEADSTLLKYALKQYGDTYYLEDSLCNEIELNGVQGMEYVRERYGSKKITRVYLRGNRLYALIYSEQKNDTTHLLSKEQFFNSFALKPFGKSTLTEYKVTEDSASILMTGIVQHQLDTMKRYYFTGERTLTRYVSIDPQNGSRFVLRVGHISPYTCIKDRDTTLYREVKYLQIHSDTIKEVKDFECNGLKGKEFIIGTEQKVETRYRAIIAGNNYYIWYYRVPLEVGTEEANKFINSFKLYKDSTNLGLADSKSELIFKDLFGKDSIRREEARWAMHGYPFDKRDIPNLNMALRTVFREDIDSLSREVAPGVLYRSRWNANGETIEILDSLFRSDAVSPREKVIILANLSRLGTDSAMQCFLGLLGIGDFDMLREGLYEENDDSNNDLEDIYLPFRDSTALFRHYFKELSMFDNPYLRQEFLSVCYDMVRADSSVGREFLGKNKPLLYKWTRKYLADEKTYRKSKWEGRNSRNALEYLSAIICRLDPDKEQVELLTKFTTSSHPTTQLWGWYGLLRNKQPYSASKFKKYMKPVPADATYLFNYLNADSCINVIPAEYLNQEFIALSAARSKTDDSYYYGDEEDEIELDSIVLVRSILVNYKDKNYRVYIFRMPDRYGDYRYGYVGPQPEDLSMYNIKTTLYNTFYFSARQLKYLDKEVERRVKRDLEDMEREEEKEKTKKN